MNLAVFAGLTGPWAAAVAEVSLRLSRLQRRPLRWILRCRVSLGWLERLVITTFGFVLCSRDAPRDVTLGQLQQEPLRLDKRCGFSRLGSLLRVSLCCWSRETLVIDLPKDQRLQTLLTSARQLVSP